MNPTPAAISPAALACVLNGLEQSCPATLRSLTAITGLGLTTVTRAVREAVRLGILAWDEGTDPESGRPCRVAVPARTVILPVLHAEHGHGTVLVSDMGLNPLGKATVELNPANTPEEGLRLLCRRGLTLLRGCAKATGAAVAAPVLLVSEERDRTAALSSAVTDAMGVSPLVTVGRGEAAARGLRGETLPTHLSSLLLLRVGGGDFACLLLRSESGDWAVSPLGANLTETLSRCLAKSGGSSEALRRGTLEFLIRCCDFLRPDGFLIEDVRGAMPAPEELKRLLPDGIEVIRRIPDEGGLSLAEAGAIRLGRRTLWDRILQIDDQI